MSEQKLTRDNPEYYESPEAIRQQAEKDAAKATEIQIESDNRPRSRIKSKGSRVPPRPEREPSNIAVGIPGSRRDTIVVIDGRRRIEINPEEILRLVKTQGEELEKMLLERGIDMTDPIEVAFATVQLQMESRASIGIDQNFKYPYPRVSPSAKEIEHYEENPNLYDEFFPSLKKAIREGYMLDPEEQEEFIKNHKQGPDYFVPGLYRELVREYKGIRIINRLNLQQWEKVGALVYPNGTKDPKKFYEGLVEQRLFTGSYINFRKFAGIYKGKK